MRLLYDVRGVTGVERALLITVALAAVLTGGFMLRVGSEQAGGDARRVLAGGGGGSELMAGMNLGQGPRVRAPEPLARQPAQPQPGRPITGQVKLPEPVNLDVPLIRQDTNVWCWLATSEMVIRYRNDGKSPKQCEMLERVFRLPGGACCKNPGRCLRLGSLQEIQALIRWFGDRQSSLKGPLSPRDLHTVLSSGKPVIAALQMTPFSGHVVVIRGVRFQPFVNAFGKQDVMPMVMVNDPLSHLPQEVPYPQLLRLWRGSIIVE